MSGHISPQLAASAGAIEFLAESKALGFKHPGQLIAQRARAAFDARTPTTTETTGAAVWRRMDLVTRTVAVMTASDAPGDARVIAWQSWDAFSDAEKGKLGAFLRHMHRQTADAIALR